MTDLTVASAGTPTGPAGAPPAQSAEGLARLSADYQSFLKLLTAQLANQDPLAPIDATQFVTQLAQFSTVEQQVQANIRLADVLTQLRGTSDRLDLGYLGRSVEVVSDAVVLRDGRAQGSYSLDGLAQRVEVELLDGSGRTVRRMQGNGAPGSHDIVWNGEDDRGDAVPDGLYRLRVRATDPDGEALPVETRMVDRVARVRKEAGETVFQLEGGAAVGREAIRGVF